MRFDVVIGNPPYQLDSGNSANNSASAIYDNFMRLGEQVSRYQLLIVPMRWAVHYNAKGIDKQWVYDELHSNKHIALNYYSDSESIFPGTRIRGGVMYYLRDNNHCGLCKVKHIESGKEQLRKLALHDDLDIFIADCMDLSILNKVWTTDRFSSCISTTTPFGIETNQSIEHGRCKLYRSFNKIDTVDDNCVTKGKEFIESFGNIVLRTFGYGDNSYKFERMPKPIIKKPYEVCTGSYLLVYPTKDEKEAIRINKFMQTNFVQYLVGLRKSTHNCTREAYNFVPMQNFSAESDIDFSLDIHEIDKQLYNKYNLSEEQQAYINSKFA